MYYFYQFVESKAQQKLLSFIVILYLGLNIYLAVKTIKFYPFFYRGWLMDGRQETGWTRLVSFIAWFKKGGSKEYSVDI